MHLPGSHKRAWPRCQRLTPSMTTTALESQLGSIVGARYVRFARGRAARLRIRWPAGIPQAAVTGSFSRNARRDRRRRALLARERVPFVPRGAGTGLSGGALADGVVLARTESPQRVSCDRCRRTGSRVVEPGVVNARAHRAPRTARSALRARSVEPGGVHDRRQRRRERGRAALPQVRRHARITCSRSTVVLPDGEVVTLGSADRRARRLRPARRIRRLAKDASASRSTSRCG